MAGTSPGSPRCVGTGDPDGHPAWHHGTACGCGAHHIRWFRPVLPPRAFPPSGRGATAVSVVAPTVVDMTTHICVWFEDGGPHGFGELVCMCGERAVVVLEDDGSEVLVVVESSPASVRGAAELAISA